MIQNLRPRSLYQCMKGILIAGVTGWALIATILLLKFQPQTLLIGIDQYGARLITTEDDRLLRVEKENFIKRYLHHAYTYTSQDFEGRMSQAGDLMTQHLWEEKKKEFSRIAREMKTQELTQTTTLQELRQVDPENFEADLQIKTKTRLQEATTRLRVGLKIKRTTRTKQNPYPYEVESYAEQVI